MTKFSIITVCYNAKNMLIDTVESVISQKYRNYEYIIIDGDSTDGTKELLEQYKSKPLIRIFSENDFGIYNAMNRGIARIDGEYVIFLNAGDTLYNDTVLKELSEYIGEEREAIYYGKVCIVSDNRGIVIKDFASEQGLFEEKLLEGKMPCHQGIVAPVKSLRNHYFRECFKFRADYEWLIYCVSKGIDCIEIPLVISKFDDSGVSSGIDGQLRMQEETEIIRTEYLKLFNNIGIDINQTEIINKWQRLSNKHLSMFLLMNQWMRMKQMDKRIEDYFKCNGYYRIAIYGISYIGKRLWDELKETDIIVDCFIDKNSYNVANEIKIYNPKDDIKDVDCVVVTAIADFEVIYCDLSSRIKCPIISLSAIFDEIQFEE